MTIKLHTKALKTLLKLEPQLNTDDERTLSLYLPIHAEGFDAAHYELLIKHTVAEYRHKLEENEQKILNSEVERVRRHLNLVRPAGCLGLAIFSNAAIGMQSLIRLPESVVERIELGRPVLETLERMLRRFPPALVAVVDKRDARLFASILGELVPMGHAEGQQVRHMKSGGSSASSNQRRADNRTRANLKKVVEMIEPIVKADGFDRIFIAGPEEARVELLHDLPKPLERLVAGHLSASLDTAPGKLLADIRAQLLKFGPVSDRS